MKGWGSVGMWNRLESWGRRAWRAGNVADPAAVRVQRGYKWLEQHGHEHGLDIGRLNWRTLDINSSVDCALGQTSPQRSFGYALRHIRGFYDNQWAYDHGFIGGADDWDALNAIWQSLVRAKQRETTNSPA